MRVFINSEDLEKLPEDTVYLHITESSGVENYERYLKEHIKNAYFLSVEADLSGDPNEDGGRRPLPDMEDFMVGISKMGIGVDTPVLVYSDSHLMNATRAWWMMKLIGVQEAYVLYEGLEGYRESGFKTSSGEVDLRHVLGQGLKVDYQSIVDFDFINENSTSDDLVLIDCRDSERYDGIKDDVDHVPGHIPGAGNYCYTNLATRELPEIEKVEEHFKELNKNKDVVLYCGSGMSATVNAAFLHEIGVKPKIYVGSYSDWVNRKN
ncbi:sulfurtransferase [Microaceticoccus formicicus]|uniref:sulfurtransferase n=1 Tax=Microaceticoccus formicicus TaxID=3118105 RepID=UPI003CD03C6A|nr:rhodanese-like domain-containing protein [Peptoniphilaceae bacterium AMB_02]